MTAITLMAAVSAGISGCGAGEPRFVSNTASPDATGTPAGTPTAPAGPLGLRITPEPGADRQPVSTEIGTDVTGGKITAVTVTHRDGTTVPGSPRDDGSSWIPAKPLAYGATYTASVTATAPDGRTATKRTTFTTMGRPGSRIGSGLYLFDDKTYGVAMPVVVEFSPGIPQRDRAAVQRRMFVTSVPAQPGAWHWVANGTQAYYRAPRYWQPGTTLDVRIAIEGIPLSNGRYGNTDRSATARIGPSFEMKVDNATKKMTVFENGALVRTIPVSLGKKSTPSSSGTMVVMEKLAETVFDTSDAPDPENRYVIDITFAQRLTWGGEYIHAAPWSVDAQGVRNVSHGCVNVSTEHAQWLFQRTKVGDPVTVSGTERKLASGNGWTAWNLSWADFVKGSALPVPANLGD